MKDRGDVLIVEDEKEISDLYKDILSREGYRVDVAMNVEEAGSRLKSSEADIVILDLRFPPRNESQEGLEFLEKIVEYNHTIKVIVATSVTDRKTALKAIGLGAYDFIEKGRNTYTELPFRVKQAYEKAQLESELANLQQEEIDRIKGYQYGEGKIIIGTSDCMRRKVYDKIDNLALRDIPVLIYGETGSGKELVAEAIQSKSRRRDRIFVRRSILEIPREGNLPELELFGRVENYPNRGDMAMPGLFESANEGTLFLDEIAKVPLEIQQRLLRVLREKVVERMGDQTHQEIPVDVRLIMAANRDLATEVEKGDLMPDLRFRLEQGGIIEIPPLRERRSDIPHLARFFIHKNQEYNPSVSDMQEDALDELNAYSWPGNVAELESNIKRAMISASGDAISAQDVREAMRRDSREDSGSLPDLVNEYEKHLVTEALSKHHWNQSEAARALGINESSLRYKIKKHNIRKGK